jgi:hypothetical protein
MKGGPLRLIRRRCIALKRGREVTLFSRNQKVLNKRFPKVVESLASLAGDFVLDGELVGHRFARETVLSASAEQPVSRASGLFLRFRSAEPGPETPPELVA